MSKNGKLTGSSKLLEHSKHFIHTSTFFFSMFKCCFLSNIHTPMNRGEYLAQGHFGM